MKKVSKILSTHIDKLNRLNDRISVYGDDIPKIETDLLLNELRNFYDEILDSMLPTPVSETPEEELATTEESEPAVPEAEPVAVAATVSPLMVDTDAEPEYAPEPEQEATEAPELPSLDEIEGNPNDGIFEDETEDATIEDMTEHEVEAPVEPEPEVETPAESEQNTQSATAPQTLWEKLQTPESSTTIADRINTGRTISDLLSETAAEPVAVSKPDTEPAQESDAPTNTAETNPASEPAPQPSLFDYLHSNQPQQKNTRTLADSLSEISNRTSEPIANTGKVQDLRTIININDKFSFMNELFHNNMKGYNDFILRLNSLTDRQEALDYVGTIADQYNWDNESLAVKTFYSIFDRKF